MKRAANYALATLLVLCVAALAALGQPPGCKAGTAQALQCVDR